MHLRQRSVLYGAAQSDDPDCLVNPEVAREWAAELYSTGSPSRVVKWPREGQLTLEVPQLFPFGAWLLQTQSINPLSVRAVASYALTSYRSEVMHGAQVEEFILRCMIFVEKQRVGEEYCMTTLLHEHTLERTDSCSCMVCGSCSVHTPSDEEGTCSCCGYCQECCSCATCGNCGERVESLECGDCRRCPDCGCDCNICSSCGNECDTQCGECSSCSECCSCPSNKLKRIKRDLLKYEAEGKQEHNSLLRLLGTEIEISRGKQTDGVARAMNKWMASVVNDGSLPVGGSEVVTQPAAGDKWVQMVTEITGALNGACGAQVSDRCGLHVHVDAGDLTVWDLRRFVKLYSYIEQPLYDLTDADEGRCAQYAKPCGQTYTAMLSGGDGKAMKQNFMMKMYGKRLPAEAINPRTQRYSSGLPIRERALNLNLRDTTREKYQPVRYNAVNLHSYFHRGTIEFRHHHGTTDTETIIHWGIAVGSLVDWAAGHSDADLLKLMKPGRSRKRVFELAVGQKATIEWMRVRWGRTGDRLNIADIG